MILWQEVPKEPDGNLSEIQNTKYKIQNTGQKEVPKESYSNLSTANPPQQQALWLTMIGACQSF